MNTARLRERYSARMMIALDVFDTEDGRYTPTVAQSWVAFNGTPTVFTGGRNVRYTTDLGWEVAALSAKAKRPWMSPSKTTPPVRHALEAAAVPERDVLGVLLEELGEPAGGEPPRTSLYALQRWVAAADIDGIVWSWDDPDADVTRYAVVRRSFLLG